MSNRLTSEPEWDWTSLKLVLASQLYPRKVPLPRSLFTQPHKASLYFVSSDKGKINTWVTFVQHIVHCSNKKFLKDAFQEKRYHFKLSQLCTFQKKRFIFIITLIEKPRKRAPPKVRKDHAILSQFVNTVLINLITNRTGKHAPN